MLLVTEAEAEAAPAAEEGEGEGDKVDEPEPEAIVVIVAPLTPAAAARTHAAAVRHAMRTQSAPVRSAAAAAVAGAGASGGEKKGDTGVAPHQLLIALPLLHELGGVVRVLRRSLSRGFEAQVFGYTLHALLARVAPLTVAGELDGDDAFGEAEAQRRVAQIASKTKEAGGGTKSLATLALLAGCVTFAP
ncbi:hypothetical protein T492DRAFT_872235 [Pavlovales sp. CCMP2436]|nr:hypothetical protein T492DRAFT_872235 [Pavlovales sp. CCMP2436]